MKAFSGHTRPNKHFQKNLFFQIISEVEFVATSETEALFDGGLLNWRHSHCSFQNILGSQAQVVSDCGGKWSFLYPPWWGREKSWIWSGWIIIRSWALISISIQLAPGSAICTGTNHGYYSSPHWRAHSSRCGVRSFSLLSDCAGLIDLFADSSTIFQNVI